MSKIRATYELDRQTKTGSRMDVHIRLMQVVVADTDTATAEETYEVRIRDGEGPTGELVDMAAWFEAVAGRPVNFGELRAEAQDNINMTVLSAIALVRQTPWGRPCD